MAILITLLLAGSSLAMLFYRAATSPTPDHVFVVRGNSDWEGVDLIVEGTALPEPSATQFQKLGKYVVPFFLPPGKYTLHILSQDVEIYTHEFDLTSDRTQELDLIGIGATTRPTTAPAIRQGEMSTTVPGISIAG